MKADDLTARIVRGEFLDTVLLDRYESYFYLYHMVKRPWVMVTNGTDKDRPTQAYFFPDPDNLGLYPIVTNFLPYGQGYRSTRTHAVRITFTGDPENAHLPQSQKAKFDICVLPEGALDGWTDGIVWGSDDVWPYPVIWQNVLWEQCGLSIPSSFAMRKELEAENTSVPRIIRGLPDEVGTAKRWLFLAMMDRHWDRNKTMFKLRASDINNAGVAVKDDSTSVLIHSKKAGLKCPNWNVLKYALASIIKQSSAYFSGADEEERRFYAEQANVPLKHFAIPDDLDEELAKRTFTSFTEHLAARLAHDTTMKMAKEVLGKSQNRHVRAAVRQTLKKERLRRGTPKKF